MTKTTTIASNFDNLGISPNLLELLTRLKFLAPTPIQHQCIPATLQGKDVVGIAQTGTGKTLAFGVPIVQLLSQNKAQALILLPTRELALQVEEVLNKLGQKFGLKTVVLIGGASAQQQINAMRRNPQIIVSTPGRLIDHLQQKNLNLAKVKMIVLDEADRMLDIGFMPQIKQILKLAPKERQTLMFSATMPKAIAEIANQFMKTPWRIEVAPAGTAAAKVEQEIFIISKEMRGQLLDKLLTDYNGSVLIFSRTKHGAKKIAILIRALGHSATEIHSNRTLNQRKEALSGFKNGKYRVLVATDIAARGIDVKDISLVINYDLPDNPDDYVHRIGRTGRAGAFGKAISFVGNDEKRSIKQIERLIKKTIPVKAVPKLPAAKIIPRASRGFANVANRNRSSRNFREDNRNFSRRRRAN
ncbi:DEAD/DEAH box helicase [Candidatus Nomurabacteria bacterium]|nr:DEAD/DEAH box helicase [Candidatus Nomurabacteria bacterium]